MNTLVEIVEKTNSYELKSEINKFLNQKNIKLVDIKFSKDIQYKSFINRDVNYESNVDSEVTYTALIIYQELQ